MKLFVRNLPYAVTDDELRDLFTPCGDVISAQIAVDRDTGQSRGFGFVEMADAEQAAWAIESISGFVVRGRALAVCESRPAARGSSDK